MSTLQHAVAGVYAGHPDLRVAETGDASIQQAINNSLNFSKAETTSIPITLILMAREDNAPASRREDLAVRVHELALAVTASDALARAAREARERKEAEVASRDAEVTRLYGEYVHAARAAENPGIAPGMPPIALGVARISDLDEEARQLIGAVAIMASAALGRSESAPPAPSADAFLRDQTRTGSASR